MKCIRVRHSTNRPAGAVNARLGFTLMEVLLVLAILGVIIALVAPNLIGQQKQAMVKSTRVQIDSIESACKIYAVDHNGDFPPSLDALVADPGSDSNWKGPYLEKASTTPADPWGNPIQYAYPGTHGGGETAPPDVWSMGPDKQPNTADDITNWKTS